jgi:hypothetical protein
MTAAAGEAKAAVYWRSEAAKFKEVAHGAEDHAHQAEFLEFARACEAVAASVEHRAGDRASDRRP